MPIGAGTGSGAASAGRRTGANALRSKLIAVDSAGSGAIASSPAHWSWPGASSSSFDADFRIDTGLANASVMWDGELRGGQLLLGPLFAQLPQNPVGLHVAGSFGPAGIALDSLDFDDPDALRLSGSIGFDRHGSLDTLALKRFAATFPAAYTRYGTTLVRSLTGFDSLTTSGSISGALDWKQWVFIPPGLTVTLLREPLGEWVHVAARTTFGTDGIAVCHGHLSDEQGPVAVVSQPVLIGRR